MKYLHAKYLRIFIVIFHTLSLKLNFSRQVSHGCFRGNKVILSTRAQSLLFFFLFIFVVIISKYYLSITITSDTSPHRLAAAGHENEFCSKWHLLSSFSKRQPPPHPPPSPFPTRGRHYHALRTKIDMWLSLNPIVNNSERIVNILQNLKVCLGIWFAWVPVMKCLFS